MTTAATPVLNTVIESAVSILKDGGLVAMPTETVYGLACDARNEKAVQALYRLKGRPGNHPVIVHLANAGQLDGWAVDIPETARVLAERFWPGPMTLILKKHPSVPDTVTGGQQTVGIRIPSHPVALQLLKAFDGGIAAPSANKFGKISPTTAAHVRADLGDEIPLVLDGGACDVGVESTIIDCTNGERLRILRPGQLALDTIQQALQEAGLDIPIDAFKPQKTPDVRVSGSLESHYAPNAAVQMLSLAEIRSRNEKPNPSVAVMSFEPKPEGASFPWVEMPRDAKTYSQLLYATLRGLDSEGVQQILVETLPMLPEWEAVQDRLKRAAAPRPA